MRSCGRYSLDPITDNHTWDYYDHPKIVVERRSIAFDYVYEVYIVR